MQIYWYQKFHKKVDQHARSLLVAGMSHASTQLHFPLQNILTNQSKLKQNTKKNFNLRINSH